MVVANNVKKYKNIFARLSKDNHSFKAYLEKNNKTVINVLEDLGLNLENFISFSKDIEKLANELISDGTCPEIAYPKIEGEDKHDNLTIYNSERNFYVEIFEHKIVFINREYADKNSTLIMCSNMTSFIHQDDKNIKTAFILNETRNSETFNQEIKAEECRTLLNGKILSEGSYNLTIKKPLLATVEMELLHLLEQDSIIPLLYKFVSFIEDKKINRKDVELEINVNSLQKK